MGLSDAQVAARLPVGDLDRARRWYAEKLGLMPAEERPGGIRYVVGETEFCLYLSGGRADGSFSQLAFAVDDIVGTVAELTARGVEFVEYDEPGLQTWHGVAEIEGNYPSKGSGERGAWFRDSEGNMISLGEPFDWDYEAAP